VDCWLTRDQIKELVFVCPCDLRVLLRELGLIFSRDGGITRSVLLLLALRLRTIYTRAAAAFARPASFESAHVHHSSHGKFFPELQADKIDQRIGFKFSKKRE
jgi:hypothetical protein